MTIPATFAELEKRTKVAAADLIDALRDYVESGAAISDKVVLEIIGRTELSNEELAIIKDLAQKGADLQKTRSESKAAAEYQKVATMI